VLLVADQRRRIFQVNTPAFLRPEATRPIAVLTTHAHVKPPVQHPGLLGGSVRAGAAGDAAVIGAAPKRYNDDEAHAREMLSALRREEAAAAAAAEAEAASSSGKRKGGAAEGRADFRSRAVAVEDVIANPSLNLPRERQERKARAMTYESRNAAPATGC
jgi:hypothetical protein